MLLVSVLFFKLTVTSYPLVLSIFREVFSHPYISLFHLLVNGFSVIYIHTYYYDCSNNNAFYCVRYKLLGTYIREKWTRVHDYFFQLWVLMLLEHQV